MTQICGHCMKYSDTWAAVELKHNRGNIPASPQHYHVGVVVRCVSVAQIREEAVELNRVLLSPQLDEPVQDKEDEQAEEQHVAQQFGLTAPGQLLHSADGGAEQAACRVKVRVLVCDRGTESVKAEQRKLTL